MRSIQDANGMQIVSRWMWANPFVARGRATTACFVR